MENRRRNWTHRPKKENNKQQPSEDSPSSKTNSNSGWETAGPSRPRRNKGNDGERRFKKNSQGSSRDPGYSHEQYYNESQPEERFNQRLGKGRKGGFSTWISEKQRLESLNLPSLRGREHQYGSNQGEVALANPLVAQYENESTAHCEEEWRKVSVVPTVEELSRDDAEVPVNIVDGPYDSVNEYLGTHYELVREDTLSGLRGAIAFIKRNPSSDDTQHVAIYENVQVLGLTFAHSHGVCVKVSFSLNRAGKQIRWQQSKRLIPGTLVCLSHDNFETFKVATVAARPMVGLEFNPPEVDLIFNVDELEIDVTKPMVMVESRQGYFEAYKWVLRAIQRMNEDNMPLGEHIVLLDQNVKPPKYLEENPVYNLTSIFPDIPNKEVVEEVNILEDWPEGVRTSLDHSQTDALKTILTKSVAVIQGPPGTGKTYTSVRALHALLQNMTEDDPPVIVACQTNHALDQLLRHVYKFEHEIIRLGGRTQDREDIKKRTLYNVRKGSQVRIHRRPEHSIRREMDEVRDRMCQALSPISADLISPDCLFELGLITEKQMESFEKGWQEWVTAATDDVPKSSISMWLRESIVPVEKVDDVYLEVEDGEIDYEALLDLEAEYLGSNNDEDDVKDELSGTFYRMKHDYHVSCPPGISDAEIRRALKTQNLWELSENLRAAAYCQWEQKAAKIVRNKLKDLNKEFQALVGKVKIARMEKDSYLMSRAKLVGMTTTGLSKYRSLVASCQPKVILIEEAAECLEAPVLVGCLPSIQHMILVGDHKQLKGKCNVAELQGEPYNLDVSMFERWVYNDMPYVALRTQRRMRPEIRELLEPIYPGQLLDHECVLSRDPVQGMGNVNLFWYCHSNFEENMKDTPSKINNFEAEMIVRFMEYLIFNGIRSTDITILTFYTGQRAVLATFIRKNKNLKDTFFKIATVDSYQGEENDIVILSLVRSNAENKIGFLSNENRVCVALSRAQRGFYIFGDARTVTAADKLWWDVGEILNRAPAKIGHCLPLTCHKHKERTLVSGINCWDDLNGGCSKPCKEKMECGHECPLKCHPFDHGEYICLEPCRKIIERCNHPCKEACYQACLCKKCGISGSSSMDELKQGLEDLENTENRNEKAESKWFEGIPRPVDSSQIRNDIRGRNGKRFADIAKETF